MIFDIQLYVAHEQTTWFLDQLQYMKLKTRLTCGMHTSILPGSTFLLGPWEKYITPTTTAKKITHDFKPAINFSGHKIVWLKCESG